MKKPENCEFCDAPLAWDLLTDGEHDKDLCFGRQFLKLKEENKKLKISEKSWRDAWYDVRDILGHLWWHHPAIDSDTERAYYQRNLRMLEQMNHPTEGCSCSRCLKVE